MSTTSNDQRSRDLVSGFDIYTSKDELFTMSVEDAPAATPVLSFIGYSSYACGGGISFIATAGATTIAKGC